jgi:hypothetical protein
MQSSGTSCREDAGLRPCCCLTIESDVADAPSAVSSLPGLTRQSITPAHLWRMDARVKPAHDERHTIGNRTPGYLIVIANPLRSAFAMSPVW